MLFAFGSNGSGQLGIGNDLDIDVPTLSSAPVELTAEATSQLKICAGGNHTLLLTSKGQILATGKNEDGRCCFMEDSESVLNSSQFLPVGDSRRPLLSYKNCSATWEATILVSSDNLLFSCGTGNKGELGQGEGAAVSTHPQQIIDFPPPGSTIVDIASSVSHTAVVLSNGEVYGWGVGRKGQIGEPFVNCWQPRKIEPIPFKANRVVCGREFTVVLGPKDSGLLAILGSDKWGIKSNAPDVVPHWKDVGASWSGIYILLTSGELLAWGRNDHCQLPTQPLKNLAMLAVGSEHVLAATDDDKLLSWGWGEHGNCGKLAGQDDFDSARSSLLSVPGKVAMLGAGCATSWVFSIAEG